MKKIPLSNGEFFIIDSEDFEKVSKYNWFKARSNRGKFYINAVTPRKKYKRDRIILHRYLMDCPENLFVDHINGDTMDNRKQNLRICSHQKNCFNQKPQKRKSKTSKYKGVSLDKRYGKWRARIKLNGKEIHIGTFANEKDAAKAYDKKARELFGDYAWPNFN